MTRYAKRGQIAAIAAAVLAAGCAGTPVADRTLVLGEVAHVLTRQEILSGDVDKTYDNQGRERIRLPRLAEALKARGLAESELQDGSAVLVRFQYYRHNALSGIVRQHLRTASVAKGLRLQTGNIVELEAQGGQAVAVRVRYAGGDQGQCGYRAQAKSGVFAALDAVNPIGGSRAVSLDCAGLAEDGWTLKPFGYGFEWHRVPAP
jgi:hypothetical protein